MSEHFIKNIEIKNYKCFNDFKAEGFGRVNLIGGKNNVGKTAFMEAIFLYTSEDSLSIYERLLVLKTYRNMQEILLSNNSSEDNLRTLILENSNIDIGVEQKTEANIDYEDSSDIIGKYYLTNILRIEKNPSNGMFSFMIRDEILTITERVYTDSDYKSKTYGESEEYIDVNNEEYSLSELINLLNSNMYKTKYSTSHIFIGTNLNDNELLDEVIGNLKLNNKYNNFNHYLNQLFSIENIDFINKKPMVKIKKKYQELSTLGEGIKSVIFYLGSLLTLQNKYLFIDEIENGIHYSKLDSLWEIILTISKDQTVQVFATTHSKECIESYARVAKKLKDEEIGFIELGRNKKNELDSVVMDSEMFQRFIKLGNEVRGW